MHFVKYKAHSQTQRVSSIPFASFSETITASAEWLHVTWRNLCSTGSMDTAVFGIGSSFVFYHEANDLSQLFI